MILQRLVLSSCILVLLGCEMMDGTHKNQDYAPSQPPNVSHIPQPTPWDEPRTRAGNKSPYNVFGRYYYIESNPVGFEQKGIASWYGKKFHGNKTSNGEIYNMYAFSAAHKTLPIPCYVRVTRLDTNKSIIVRVNDRGPFHSGRVIDLSFTAADALGMVEEGTASVKVEYIDPKNKLPEHVKHPFTKPYLQVAAFSSKQSSKKFRQQLLAWDDTLPAFVKRARTGESRHFKVLIGPIPSHEAMSQLQQRLDSAGYGKGYVTALH